MTARSNLSLMLALALSFLALGLHTTNAFAPLVGFQPHAFVQAPSETALAAVPRGLNNTLEELADEEEKLAPKKKKKGYQRAEEWDAEQKAGGMTWEQKVQFDGLRMGNRVRQNAILQKHLGSF